jgi:NAD(P)-dependent dehydrogenase (short-subunit alcohol dehydrogenase family)
MAKEKILVIGASGQIGVELTLALRKIYGDSAVIASDLREEKNCCGVRGLTLRLM